MEREWERENDINVKVEVIEWDVYVEEAVRIWSLRSSVETATAKRHDLFVKLEAKLQVRKESLSRSDEVEAMYRKLELHRQRLGCSLLSLKEMSQEVKAREEKLATLLQSLSGAAKSLSAAHGRLQEANKLLAEGGNGQLWHLKKMLLARQKLMVTQVSSLYPIARAEQPNSGEGSGLSPVSTCTDSPVESLTIAGLQLFGPPLKKLGFFNDKQEFQSSATALGYVAHIIKLIASYLDIPLRYPLRLGGSRSYIQDYASPVEPSINEQEETSGMDFLQKHVVEFPLFSEGQEPTRSAYAVFLLNKFSTRTSTFTRDSKPRRDTSFVESIDRGVAATMASSEPLTKGLVTPNHPRAFEVDLQSDYLMALELEKSLNNKMSERVRKTPSSPSSPSTRRLKTSSGKKKI